ncbi:hypothetical protein TcWFU_008137 [Taenia crassiceps]|uniref:Glutathione peroxidase n=1 Tax=Taenia crassiceps TaxID=6207 RepID=A0ABR4QHP3_9CEST
MKEAARNNFGLTFDFFSKVDINGPEALPLFIYLQNALPDTPTNIKWNFTKFLIDRNGVPNKRYSPATDPKVPDVRVLRYEGGDCGVVIRILGVYEEGWSSSIPPSPEQAMRAHSLLP